MSRQAKFKLFGDKLVSASQSITSEKIPVQYCSGYFALSGSLSGSNPEVKIEYLKGNGDTFIIDDTPISDNCSNSPFSIQFFPQLCESVQIKFTNISSSDVNVTAALVFSEN